MKRALTIRYLSIIIVLFFVFQLIPSAAAADQTSQNSSSPVELIWYLYGNRQEPGTDAVCNAADDYLLKTYGMNVKIKLKFLSGNYRAQMASIISSGQPFDICFTSDWSLDYYQSYGSFLPLNDYLRNSNISRILGQGFLDASRINGINYALPAYKEEAHNYGLLLKKDLVSKYNVNPESIHSLSDLEPVFARIKAGDPGITPLYINQADNAFPLLDWNNIVPDCPGALYSDNRNFTVVNQFAAPETAAFFSKMREYYNRGYISTGAAYNMIDTNTAISSGRYFAVVQSLKPNKYAEMSSGTGVNWVQVDITKPVIGTSDVSGAMLAINSNSKHPDEAFRFIEKLYTDETLKNLFDNGIEGINYTYSNGNLKHIGSSYNPGTPWTCGNYFLDYANQSIQSDFDSYNRNALLLNTTGFIFNPSPVQGGINAVKNVQSQYLPRLCSGSVDPATELPKFLSALKAAGVDDVIAEMQRQVNAWKAVITRPKNLKVSLGEDRASLTWTSCSDPELNGYQLEYKAAMSVAWNIITIDRTAAAYTVEGLEKGMEYQFRIKAKDINNNWTQYSDLAVGTIPPPQAPAGISFSFDGMNAGRLVGITRGMEYSLDGGRTYFPAHEDNQLLNPGELNSINAENDIRVRLSVVPGASEGADTVLNVLEGPEAPSILSNDITNTVKGLTDKMEFSTDNGKNWIKYENNVPKLDGNVALQVRLTATGLTIPSQITSVKFTSNPQLKVIASYKSNVITLTLVNGQFAEKLNKDAFAVAGLPSGVTKGTVKRLNDTKASISLKGSSTHLKSLKIKIDKKQILPVQTADINVVVKIPAGK